MPTGGDRSLPVLQAIARGVADLRIPASTDWPAAQQHLTDLDGHWKLSAVLVAIVTRREPTILLTKRSSGLSEYSSHVSFPGGRPMASDGSVARPRCARHSRKSAWPPMRSGCWAACPCTDPASAITPSSGDRHRARHGRLGSGARRIAEIFEFPFSALLDPALPRQYADGERSGAWYWAGSSRTSGASPPSC